MAIITRARQIQALYPTFLYYLIDTIRFFK